jgi:hypothetical protein
MSAKRQVARGAAAAQPKSITRYPSSGRFPIMLLSPNPAKPELKIEDCKLNIY